MTRFATVLVPNMPIAVVRRDEPALAQRPILLYEDRGGRATIVAAEATTGLVGLPLRQAATRCPAAVVRRAQPAQVAQAVRLLRGVLDRFSPRVARQQQGADVALIAGLGASSLPAALALAARLLAAVQAALRLSPALGLAATPAVAHMAARIAGAGAAIVVPVGQEAAFLAPQPIALLPIVPAIAERLRLFGLRTIGAVARLPRDALEAQFGIIGGALHDLAHGRDQASLWVAPSVAQVGVRRHFAGAVLDARVVLAALDGLAAALAVRLEAGGWAARTLTLTVTLVDDPPQVAGRTLAVSSSDARHLGAVLRALFHTLTLPSGVEALAVAATDLATLTMLQAELFVPAAGRIVELDATLAQLAARFPGQLLRAVLADTDAACPEWRVRLDPWTVS